VFKQMANVSIVHVPFKGGGESMIATAAGHVDMSFATVPSILPFSTTGRIRPLAVTTASRASAMPELPTLHESGLPGYERSSWQGVLAPAGTPAEVIAQLNAAIAEAVNSPELKEAFRREGLDPHTTTPQAFAAHIRSETARTAKLFRQIGLKPE
jgi:tripartite-type tricarboxylate transporter receptor subunit TctC